FRRTHLAKRSVQIVQFIASDESQVEIASGTGGNRRSLSPTGVFGRQEPLRYGLRISPQAEHFVTRRGEASFNVQRSTWRDFLSSSLRNVNTSRGKTNPRREQAVSDPCDGAQ